MSTFNHIVADIASDSTKMMMQCKLSLTANEYTSLFAAISLLCISLPANAEFLSAGWFSCLYLLASLWVRHFFNLD
ncbi:hypothetical protein EB796_016429 [Bugula neritina]|uniref:Uncharacterized protein n=1 Tax=Bugula neritina TaxID=10212 RepID=A0A7J7JI22_BUGNE|nr:hypothetical protein EB796_016429 [Bugula neritina]